MKTNTQHSDSPYTTEEIRFAKGIAAIIVIALIAFGVGMAIVDRA